jgi:hypothetical protein
VYTVLLVTVGIIVLYLAARLAMSRLFPSETK